MSLEFFLEKKLIEDEKQENNLPHFEKSAGIAACLLAIIFLASVAILLIVQTKNLCIGLSTYERLSRNTAARAENVERFDHFIDK